MSWPAALDAHATSHVRPTMRELRRHQLHRLSWSVVCLQLLCGCTTLPEGRGWGADATVRPGWQKVREAASNAARDPWVWAPLLGAAAFQIDDWDRRTADWARERTPLFGSTRNAKRWSDDLRNASSVVHYATLAAVPSGPEPREWLLNKTRGTLVHVAAVSSTVFLTRLGKTSFDRERPNASDRESFPSGHTSSSAVHTRLASRNLQSLDLSASTRRALDGGLYALTIGTSWSRVEAGFHFPSDTLVGMALGNFMASFFNDAFLGLADPNASLALSSLPEGVQLQWRIAF
jgi:membrane-associated phospholipid phosphatase